MRISRLSVRRPVTTLMVFLGVVVLGVVSYRQLPVQLLPDFTMPAVGVYLSKPSSSTGEMLEELTKPVESIIADLPRVKAIRSWTGAWGVWIRVEFETGTDIRFTTLDLQERLLAFQQRLPDRRTTVQVFPFSTDEFKNYLMEVSLEGAEDHEVLYDLMRDRIEPRLKSVSGVAKVEVGGVISESVEAQIDPARLAGFGLDFGQVFGRLQAAGRDDTYMGRLRIPGQTHYVRMDTPVRNTGDLRELPMDARGVVRLDDIAYVGPSATLNDWLYRSNGKNAVGLRIDREEGENLLEVARKVRQRIDEINETLPGQTRLEIQTDVGEIVEKVIGQVRNLALLGGCLALLVPLVFFRSWRIAFIICISVPISIIAVFNLFYFFGMSINIFSIIGLALGVGMLVDNSIVVVENCFRLYFGRRMSPAEAAGLGGDEVGRALLASTLTSCVPFVSFLFIEGDFRLFVKEPALALVFPLMLSLLVALTLSAMLTAKALETIVRHKGALGRQEWERAARRLNPRGSRLREGYRWLLKACLRHRGRVLGVIAILLTVVWFDACDAVRESTTNREQNFEVFPLYLDLPAGTTTGEASEKTRFVEERLAQHEDIERFAAWMQRESVQMNIRLFEPKKRPSGRTLEEIQQRIIDYIGPVPGGQLSLTPPTRNVQSAYFQPGDRGTLELRGLEMEQIEAYANRLVAALELLPEVTYARIEERNRLHEYELLIDREKARLFGLNAQTLGQFIGVTRADGQISSLILKDGDDRTDVLITLADVESDTIEQVKQLPVRTATGSTVPLGELGTFRPVSKPAGVGRSNRQSRLNVEYFWHTGGDQGAILRQVRDTLRKLPNPAGITAEIQGRQQQLEQQHKDFLFALLVGVTLIYVVMASIFESYWIPFTIIATNPLMLVGIVLALAITGLPFEELAAFGVILLNGLAVNNGIVLMDTAVRYRTERNFRRLRAVFQAADQRLRPILMTFLTTSLGLLPLALSGDASAQWRPVAVTVVGGLTSATLLTLLVLPCFYMIGDDFVQWLLPRWKYVFGRAMAFVRLPLTLLRRLRRKPLPAPPPAVIPVIPVREDAPVVAVQNLHVLYPEFHPRDLRRAIPTKGIPVGHRPSSGHMALQAVTFAIQPGLFGLLGPNGAGKTTLMRCIAGLLPPTRGTVRLFGASQREAGELLAPLVGYLPQTQGLYEWMTLRQYLEFFARLTWRTIQEARVVPGANPILLHLFDRLAPLDTRAARREAIERAAAEVHLEHVLDERLSSFSGGMKQRAGIARVLLQTPPILIVDEPTAGLDPVERVNVRLILSRLARERTVIFSTHIVEDLEETCDALAILDEGRLLFSGTPAALRARWQGRVWQVPLDGDSPDALRERIAGGGGRILFRYARGGESGFRVIASSAPHERGAPSDATLEDALLGVLDAERGEGRGASGEWRVTSGEWRGARGEGRGASGTRRF